MPISRPRHPKPVIEKTVQYAEQIGWRVVLSSGHAWGRLYCPLQLALRMHHQRVVHAAQPGKPRSTYSQIY